jgi:hypothetical protein
MGEYAWHWLKCPSIAKGNRTFKLADPRALPENNHIQNSDAEPAAFPVLVEAPQTVSLSCF